ncbi:MAG: hypothetical protein PHW73_02355 [Atribacterota bacterium]|nr:hypothetical protein [Atribacterota bacterium]
MDFLITNAGWFGIFFAQFVPWFQIYKTFKSKKSGDISILTYVFLDIAVFFYLVHALAIQDLVFIVAQALALFSNILALCLILKHKKVCKRN